MPITSHLGPQHCPNVMTFSNAANECSFHFLKLKVATDGSFVVQRSDKGPDELQPLAKVTQVEAGTVNDAPGHRLQAAPSHLIALR